VEKPSSESSTPDTLTPNQVFPGKALLDLLTDKLGARERNSRFTPREDVSKGPIVG